jgi:ESS family glutamate:Na+ symporter
MLAGLLALALGQNGMDILPFSGMSYGSLLIAIIFASLGLTTALPKASTLIYRTGKLWAFNQIITISQWLLAIALGAYVLSTVWPDLPAAFGIVMPAGFMGGHGTAAAVGESLTKLHWENAMSLALTAATIGVFLAVLGGLAMINIMSRLGILTHIKRFEELDEHFRKGLIPVDKRTGIGQETVAASSLNAFTLHIALIGVVVMAAYYLSTLASLYDEFVSVPIFACAFLFGCIMRAILKSTNSLIHFDDDIIRMSAGSATDFLVFFGIASIKLSVLVLFATPFILLILSGIMLCVFLVLYVAPKLFGDKWVEVGLFSWGWMTGTVAMGILLLRMVDPKGKSKVLDDYALAYLPGSIVDIILISFIPGLIMAGFTLPLLTVMSIYLVFVISIAFYIKHQPVSVNN